MSEIAFNIGDKIREIEKKLYDVDIESKFIVPKEEKEFKKYRDKWTSLANRVRNQTGTDLINKLEQNEKGFEDGIKTINQEIQEINDTVDFLNIFSQTINILEKIVPLRI